MLRILHLADDRPGHYHLADGVIAALSRLTRVEVERREVARRGLIPSRLTRQALNWRGLSPAFLLKLFYSANWKHLPVTDLVISAGGDTLGANVLAARALGAQNIFCGSLRSADPQDFSAVISSYQRHAGLPRHIVALKPSGIDHARLRRPAIVPVYGADNPPARAALLIGGDSGEFRYRREEWRALFVFAKAVSAAWGTRWLISTSRRTGDEVGDMAAAFTRESGVVDAFLDYRDAGPGTLPDIFARSDIVVCTEDSSTMISESISARLPTVSVGPSSRDLTSDESEYREFMHAQHWLATIPIAQLSPDALDAALARIGPLDRDPLDRLAGELAARLPGLLRRD